MPILPKETVKAILAQEHEIPAAREWARRRKLEPTYDEEALTLRLLLQGPGAAPEAAAEPYLLTADLEDYNVLPPTWRFVDPRTGAVVGIAAYPKPNGNSVFHSNGVICAPWSRLAYKAVDERGPHEDWGPPTNWKTAAPNHTRALTIPDMLDRIWREVSSSRGRMAPLPPPP